jgi:hypothetical protein
LDLILYLGFGFCNLGFGIWNLCCPAASMAENNPEELTYRDSAAHIRVAQKESR